MNIYEEINETLFFLGFLSAILPWLSSCYSPIPISSFALLGCSDFHNKISQASTREIYFLTGPKAQGLRSSFQPIWFLVRALFLACRWLLSHYVLTWLGACSRKKRKSSLVSLLIKTLILLDQGSTLSTSFNFNYFLSGPKYSHWR